ncbi:MAG: hypothetical protein NC826_02295 [Candidatus Omnitrophica bacterium]|nr:hypothetical protein [Candidatus Omnitrophota bacterium]
MVYRYFKRKQRREAPSCPDEEMLASFLEGRVSEEESKKLQQHLLSCYRCAELLKLSSLKGDALEVPAYLLEKAKALARGFPAIPLWIEALIMLKEKSIKIVKTSADILLGNEIIPLPVLRSRKIEELPQQLSLIKDAGDIRISIEINRIKKTAVKITVLISEIKDLKPLEDVRIGLFKNEIERESYSARQGKVVFEEVELGSYLIKVSRSLKDIGMIKLELT